MAQFKHFAELNGETVQFTRADYRLDGVFGFHAPTAKWIKVTRTVQYKRSPSRHTCDARCMFATGRTMTCECACGGANHGKGAEIMQRQGELI